ncbi:MAG: segregation/condensation protein A [Clostridiales bacterium]|nr:segregation/condensation protein A [Clostridiales bacterium]
MNYEIHLDAFDGPFDLLLHLIKENQVDIYDIPIASITAQYLAYLEAMEAMDLEITSNFLVMAATLLAIKAKMLLPKSVLEDDDLPEEDARAELVHDLLEYMRFKEAAADMENIYKAETRHYNRPNEEELYLNLFSAENPLDGKTLADLTAAFQAVLAKVAGREEVMNISRDDITVKDKLNEIFGILKENPQGIEFSAVFINCRSKLEMVISFLALLELVRQKVIRISQRHQFGEIYLHKGDLSRYCPEAV